MITFISRPWNKLSREFLNEMMGSNRGPESVVRSLKRGLKELEIPYRLNPSKKALTKTVHVLRGAEALKEAINLKREGIISKLIAGPNITVTPFEEQGLYLSPEIDCIVFPSEWPKNFFISLVPELAPKIKIWSAGVLTPSHVASIDINQDILIYQKNAPSSLLSHIEKTLKKNSLSYRVLRYNKFRQEDYFRLLEKSRLLIYLSESESQGLALQEAWIRNVPTLVWNRGFWQYGSYSWSDSKISAPYLTDEAGMFFRNEDDFENKLISFMNELKNFTPREYALARFTDHQSALQLIDIINAV